jgi:uncharacterized protein Yka (UPF0111/DUF47 family)
MRNIRALIFPHEGIFFELLEKESKAVLQGATLLKNLTSKYDSKTTLYRKKIKEVEHEADEIVHDIHQHLNSSFITPIDHEDIADLANSYDDVMDAIYSLVNRFYIYKIKKVDPTICSLSKIVYAATLEIDAAFISMKKLSQREMNERFVTVHSLETEADEVLDSAIADLFKKKNFVDILKYKEMYEILEGAVDRCEDVVDILRNIVLKHS